MKLDLSLDIASTASAADWVNESRRKEIEKQKQAAAEKARRLQEEEDELVQTLSAGRSRLSGSSNNQYTSSDLKGMKVRHSANAFEAGSEVILTLADTDVLATDEYGRVQGLNDDEDDILENVNISEHERKLQRDKQLKRLKQPLYSGYDDAEFENGKIGIKQDILPQYEDEEMKRKRQRLEVSFVLGDGGATDLKALAAENSSQHAHDVPQNRVLTSLAVESKQMSAFMTKEEVKFRKTKKSEKKRSGRSKKQDGDDEEDNIQPAAMKQVKLAKQQNGEESYDLSEILAEGGDDEQGLRMDVEDKPSTLIPPLPPVAIVKRPRLQAQAVVFEDEDEEFAAAMARARALANKNRPMVVDEDEKEEDDNRDRGAKMALQFAEQVAAVVPKQVATVDDDDVDIDGRRSDGKLVFNSTMEFAARLQAVINDRARTQAEAALKGMEKTSSALDLNAGDSSLPSRARATKHNDDDMSVEDGTKSVNKSVNSNLDSTSYTWEDLTDDDEGGQDEPDGALVDEQLAFLHRQPLVSKGMAATLELLKSSGELNRSNDLAGRAKDSRSIDPSREEGGVKIEYRDEFGRKLTQKEAFRQLSYKFHGYGPSKKKLEKRLKVIIFSTLS